MNAAFRDKADPIADDAEAGRVLLGMLGASSDACWCMEFGEPVDLSAPDREIVRQVFENDPHWRFCNAAMARLYLLAADERFEERPVHEIFPRNPQNEAFVRRLIDGGFEIDRAPALDTRYDGVEIHVENDVRAHVVDGQLIRMFGIVRDVGKHRRRELLLQARLDNAIALLDALPDPFVALDAGRIVVATNPAAERLFGRPSDALAGLELRHALEPRFSASDAERLLTAAERVTGDDPESDGGTMGAEPMPTTLDVAVGRQALRCTLTRHAAGGGGVLLAFAATSPARDGTRAASARRTRSA